MGFAVEELVEKIRFKSSRPKSDKLTSLNRLPLVKKDYSLTQKIYNYANVLGIIIWELSY